MEFNRSVRLEKGSSMRLGRSNSTLLESESLSSECARSASYERLSQSMRLSSEFNSYGGSRSGSRKNRAWGILSKVFSFNRKINGQDESRQGDYALEQEEKKKKKKKKKRSSSSSSWLPDPNRRWPVQGW